MDDIRAALWAYTLERGDPTFVHQHAVDAMAAQLADAETIPLQLAFALIGLYLHVERGYTGRQVQRVHAELAKRRPMMPTISLPAERGSITASDVLAAPAGAERDAAIDDWCASVWSAYAACRGAIIELLRKSAIAEMDTSSN